MTQRDEVQKFEQGRIKVLIEERLHIQKKTFTKWMNSFLQKARMEVEDLFVDLADGKKLLKLLEIISGEKLAKPNNGKMRVHKIENVNKSLAFLHTKVRLESIGAEDIVDGNPRLILGLIWTIILRFQIQEIEIDVDEENESSEKKSAKDALLLWAQRKTHGYPDVHINDFTGSWRSGLGFNALIHAHRPDLFDYDALLQNKNIDNLNHAFDVANNELGIPPLLDAEDVDQARPDEKSIMTYVASYYHTFARMKNEAKSGRRIAKIIGQMMDADKMKISYEKLTTDLLEWINLKIVALEDRNFPNSLEGIQSLLVAFGQYRTREKPPKYIERSEIEALFFNINTQLKELRQPAFLPADGKLVQDIERSWEILERAEHNREVALRTELLRQERLEQLNFKFESKSILREAYLKEMMQVLSDPRYGSNLAQVDATVKKHEAISADILTHQQRFHDLTEMKDELTRENYRNVERVKIREDDILRRWHELLDCLERHKINLNRMGNVLSSSREIDTTLSSIYRLISDLSSVDTGVHLLAVEELLHRHALQELQVNSLGETTRKLKRLREQETAPKEAELLKTKLNELDKAYDDLQQASATRKALLEEARNFYQFLQDQEDEEAWLVEKQRICQAGITAKDLRGVLSLQQKHKLLLDEIKSRKNKFEQLALTGHQLIKEQHPKSVEIQQHIDTNKLEWKKLERLADDRHKQLQDAAQAYQFYADANEADSWLNEKTSILTSSDCGTDEPSAQALLQRHKKLQEELNAYKGDIHSMNNQADQLISTGISHLDLAAESEPIEPIEEWTHELKMVPMEFWEEEPVEKIEYKTIMEERTLPQVKALYPFNDHGLSMQKGEIMILLNRSNPDWWSVRKSNGTDGFAPANYVMEIEPRIIQIPVKKQEKIKSVQRVKKSKMVKQKVPVKVRKTSTPAIKRKLDDDNSIEKRVKKINDTYDDLQQLATRRHALLEDAIRMFRFYCECDDFEKWIKDKEKLLANDDPKENIEQAKRLYEKFVTDLSASNKRMETLDAEVRELQKENHSQIDKVRARHRQVQNAWDKLNKLKAQKERSLAGASTVELFQRTCDEARDWMEEKMMQLDTASFGEDLKTVQALQRRHEHLERELAPVEEKVNRVNLLANEVQSAYPHEKNNVIKRQNEIKDLWQKVKEKATDRRARLEDLVGLQIFTNSSRSLLNWVSDVKNQLNADNTVRDVQTAEHLMKNHDDLHDDIKAHDEEFKQVTDLGTKLLNSNPSLNNVHELLERLIAERAAIHRGWNEKHDWLKQCLELQKFNKEADKIDAATSSHEAILEFNNLGNSLDEVEALLKQHRALVNTLDVQDERLQAFSKKADTLMDQKHYDSDAINERRNQVLDKRFKVKLKAQQRTQELDASKNYQEFCAEVDDLRKWLNEKLKTASDQSYRDLSNLERKLQKHEAFERELRANEGQIRNVNKLGQALIAQDSYKKEDVAKTLKDLNDIWQKLVGISLEKGRRLRQAVTQHSYNTSIDDVQNKINEIDGSLRNTNVGNDLRSCKELLKKHEMIENELTQCASRVDDLTKQSNEMAHDDHFDSNAIENKSLESKKKLKALDGPMKRRRDDLEESLKFYKFLFELDNELEWIKDHVPSAASETLGQNLHEAQNLCKKHKKLEAEIIGHQPVIDRSLENGQVLIEQRHPESKRVEEKCNELRRAWKDLNEKANRRMLKLELSLKAQQYFFEASEVESWLNEKSDILSSTDYGRDRDSATKLLTKHKALELELDTYSSIINEMGRGTQALIQSGHPESKAISERQAGLEHLVRSLQRRSNLRRHRLMESLFRHEYFLESAELEQWIGEQMQQASSEDYGQDYEHLQVLQGKFDDFKHRVEAGSERIRQCDDLAQKLIANESPYTADIETKQQQLGERRSIDYEEVITAQSKMWESWEKLKDQIKHREKRLHAAGEIHRFHRDVSDALSRIHEKNAALGTELGRDLNSALAFLRRQEAFENELVVLEAQLQVLVDDAARLQATYPSNRVQIQQKQELVVTAWRGLKERADLRRDQLQASVDFQKFLTQVRDLTGWASGLRITMTPEEKVRNISRAQTLKSEHDALKVEIEARESTFKKVAELSTAMEQTGHYAATEAVERCDALLDEREKLHDAWRARNTYLGQLIDLHAFLREAKQLENISNVQEAALSNVDFGETVEEVTKHVKKHEAFEKLITTHDERLENLFQTGDTLIEQNHFESGQIASCLADVQSKRLKVRQLCLKRHQQLENALLYAEFIRDVTDALNSINEKQKKLQNELKTGEVNNLDDKIKKLQKYQTLHAEVAANDKRIDEIKDKGEKLISKRHKSSPEIKKQLIELDAAWQQLLHEVNLRGKGLEEARDILEFNNHLDKLEGWIRDKEVMIQAGDTGKDYEHCQALQRKLDDVDSDMRVDDSRLKNINSLANKLIKQGRSGVQERWENFIRKWHDLQGALTDYRDTLGAASEIHLFERDVADTLQRILDKTNAMEIDDVGKDLNGVECLIRKQNNLERDMVAVENKMTDHEREALHLFEKYPEKRSEIQEKVTELEKRWEQLIESKERRDDRLKNAYAKHKFFAELKELEIWTNETVKRMRSQNKPTTVSEAEVRLELHDEIKAEIDGRQETFDILTKIALESVENKDEDFVDVIRRLENLQDNLRTTWKHQRKHLTHEYHVQNFKEQADQIDGWLASKEAFLNNDDIGENPRAVDALIRKHQDFETMLHQQLTRIDDLEKMANDIRCEDLKEEDLKPDDLETDDLKGEGNYDNSDVSSRFDAIVQRKNKLIDTTKGRKNKLEQSRSLHEFVRNIHEVELWVAQEIQVANDENYRDPSNLQSKIQKHAAFDAEILANSNRIVNVLNDGQNLINDRHFASKDIATRLEDLENDWLHLQNISQLKRERLNDAYQALLFNRSLDEFDEWITTVEQQLQSQDYGKDLSYVNNLLKKHIALENDVQQHTKNCESINEAIEECIESKHFMCDEMQERGETAISRFHQLQEPMQSKRDLLESSLMFHQFSRDVDDELRWLSDREPLVASNDLGNSLTAVQRLQKKHLTLEAELLSHEPIVGALVTRSGQLVRSGHHAANTIGEKAKEVKNKLTQIRDLASIRKLRLQDALEAQMFYAEATEVLAWMQDKRPLLASSEVGGDEDSAQSLQKKLEALDCEVTAFEQNIERLSKTAKDLVDRQHFDAENVTKKLTEIANNYNELQSLVSEREKRLTEALAYFGFIRECNELQDWMNEQQIKAASEDYGTDVEHVELLTKTFETFFASLLNSKARVVGCIDIGNRLIANNNEHCSRIEYKVNEIKDQWGDLLELANARSDALAGAKLVHTFDRTADETIVWIAEKESSLNLDYYSQNLEDTQALLRKHAAFENELVVVKTQVDGVEEEAERLISLFPDAEEHIDVKREDVRMAWDDLSKKAEETKEKLYLTEQLQSYFDQHQDLLAWINEMIAKITAPDLPQDVVAAELLIERHKEHKVEIDARADAFKQFSNAGNLLIKEGHFLSQDIENRILTLQQRMDVLLTTWLNRSLIYNQNLDVQLFKREANSLENWILIREGNIRDGKVGESINQVEDLIRKHEDFEKTILAQEDKFQALKRKTLVEEAFAQQLELEKKAKETERERLEQERLAQRKQQEMQRITELRRQESQRDDRKKTDELNGTNNLQKPNISSSSGSPFLTKSNSVAHMFADRTRRGQDVKRAESMKTASKPVKRTPSFTTRRRSSFRGKTGSSPLVEAESFLERKQVSSHGKKAANRTWKNLYTVLCGQLLCFFKNKEDFLLSKALFAPIPIHNCTCTIADDYNKRKCTFRLVTPDESEYLFACSSHEEMNDWMSKISFRAKLPPSQQLLHFEVPKDTHELDQSSQSSRTSSPDVTDSVILRHDPQFQNGNSQGNRHTISGESPPPLPMTEPPNNIGMRRHHTLENNSDSHGFGESSKNDWNNGQRSSSMQSSDQHKRSSSRIMDLFRKKRNTSSQM